MNEEEIDRLSELLNIGAGHAATAFAGLAGRSMRMSVPRVRAVSEESEGGIAQTREGATGVLFELEGCLEGLVGILFSTPECEATIACLLGRGQDWTPESVQSALMELGNILASHVASAIADTLGGRLLPSLPSLVMGDAERELLSLASHRGRGGVAPLRIECELADGEGELGGLLVLIPDPVSH